MLKQLSHSLLTSEELVKSAERLFQCGNNSSFKNILEKRIKKTAEASNQLSEALDESLTNIYASRVQQADLQRDDAFQAFKYGVLSASYRSERTIKESGETLVEIVRKHGFSLYNLGYIAQSEAMKNLMSELSKCMNEVSKSGMADLYEEMVSANEHFNDVYHEKLEDEAGKETPQIVVGKREVSKQITLFLNFVELLEDDKEKGVNDLVESLNQVISEIMQEARERQKTEV